MASRWLYPSPWFSDTLPLWTLNTGHPLGPEWMAESCPSLIAGTCTPDLASWPVGGCRWRPGPRVTSPSVRGQMKGHRLAKCF